MAFQPMVDVQTRRIDAYEALVRGPSNEGASFVLDQVTVENTYAFDQACRVKAIELAARLGLDRSLSINFLPGAVYEPEACIRQTLLTADRTGFPPDKLIFEILETQSAGDNDHMMNIMTSYRKHGFRIALDDFGTGFSGLKRLVDLKPDIVKIDRSLTRGCDRDTIKLAVVGALVHLGGEIGVQVVVEGPENAMEVEALLSVGARFIQGYYFGKPLFESMATDGDVPWPTVAGRQAASPAPEARP